MTNRNPMMSATERRCLLAISDAADDYAVDNQDAIVLEASVHIYWYVVDNCPPGIGLEDDDAP